jgi:hypothetical protein
MFLNLYLQLDDILVSFSSIYHDEKQIEVKILRLIL